VKKERKKVKKIKKFGRRRKNPMGVTLSSSAI
jgi:hypothetical protein